VRSVRTRHAERPEAWPSGDVGLDPREDGRELTLEKNERNDRGDS
jgi:hypothetical protein